MNRLLLVLVAASAAAAARADIINLTNGNRLEGRATVEGDRVKVQMGQGWLFLRKEAVASIEKKDTPLDVFDRKYAALAPKDVPGRLQLAGWCREQELVEQNRKLLNEVLALDPDNAEARRLSGHVQHKGQWVTVAERNRELGLVEFEGQWHTPQALAELLKARAAAEQAQAELRKLREELQQQPSPVAPDYGWSPYYYAYGRYGYDYSRYPYGYYGYRSGYPYLFYSGRWTFGRHLRIRFP